ncbi:MAG: virulence RhuM family protein [Flavobacteriaceae bacterium]|nr:virulence RhuM family protein [Flavobacteriaceae bacterium]
MSVGYRVKSLRGTQFRIWANKILKEYLLKGYVLNQKIEKIEKKLKEHDETSMKNLYTQGDDYSASSMWQKY